MSVFAGLAKAGFDIARFQSRSPHPSALLGPSTNLNETEIMALAVALGRSAQLPLQNLIMNQSLGPLTDDRFNNYE